MKAAMWGVGLVVLGLFGLVMVNLFGNITVTNQFNYTTMKNAVKAAMLDSLDIPHYRTGFCLCTSDDSLMKKGTQKIFDDKNEYEFRDLVDDKCGEEDSGSCVALYGEYRLMPDKFTENFKDRFERMITNNKEYDYIIKEIIEYPPKVSVRVVSKDDSFSPTERDSDGYNIVNQMDAIIEANGGSVVFIEDRQNVDDTIEIVDEADTKENGAFQNCGWYYRVSSEFCTDYVCVNNDNYNNSSNSYSNNSSSGSNKYRNFFSTSSNTTNNNKTGTSSNSNTSCKNNAPSSSAFHEELSNYNGNRSGMFSSLSKSSSSYGVNSRPLGTYDKAMEECGNVAKNVCKMNNYETATSHNCTAFRIFRMTNADGSNSKIVERSSVPTCTNEKLSPGCIIECL